MDYLKDKNNMIKSSNSIPSDKWMEPSPIGVSTNIYSIVNYINDYILTNTRMKIINYTLDEYCFGECKKGQILFENEKTAKYALSTGFDGSGYRGIPSLRLSLIFNKITKKFLDFDNHEEYYKITNLLRLFGYYCVTYNLDNQMIFDGGYNK